MKTPRAVGTRRRLHFEWLEARAMMAADAFTASVEQATDNVPTWVWTAEVDQPTFDAGNSDGSGDASTVAPVVDPNAGDGSGDTTTPVYFAIDPVTIALPPVDPAIVAPTTTDPVTTDPGTIDPVIDPVTIDPATISLPPVDPMPIAPITTDPVTIDPVTIDPVTIDPVTIDPGTIDPGTIDPGTFNSVWIDTGDGWVCAMSDDVNSGGMVAPTAVDPGQPSDNTLPVGMPVFDGPQFQFSHVFMVRDFAVPVASAGPMEASVAVSATAPDDSSGLTGLAQPQTAPDNLATAFEQAPKSIQGQSGNLYAAFSAAFSQMGNDGRDSQPFGSAKRSARR